jgi:protease I
MLGVRNALLIIAKLGYQDVELDGVRDELEAAGFSVTLASTQEGECTGKFGGEEHAEFALDDVNVKDYDRVGFIGGPGAANLWQNAEAKRIAQDAVKAKKPLGAICIAPKILAAAEVLVGKKATVWNKDGDQEGFLAMHDVHYTGEPVTVDGLIVTGNGPEASEEFGKVFANLK